MNHITSVKYILLKVYKLNWKIYVVFCLNCQCKPVHRRADHYVNSSEIINALVMASMAPAAMIWN